MAFERNRRWKRTCFVVLGNVGEERLEVVNSLRGYYAAEACFCTTENDFTRGSNYLPIKPGSLSRVDLETHLLVFSHGSPDTVAGMLPEELAARFEEWGLRSVGLISFRSCSVGASDYLEKLRDRLVMTGANVGYLIAYRGAVNAIRGSVPWVAFPFQSERVAQRLGDIKEGIRPLRLLRIPERFRIKVVKGNAETCQTAKEVRKGRTLGEFRVEVTSAVNELKPKTHRLRR